MSTLSSPSMYPDVYYPSLGTVEINDETEKTYEREVERGPQKSSNSTDLSREDVIFIEFEKPLWLQSVLESIDSIAKLPPNWDGYNSPPLNPEARQYAISILKFLENFDLPEPNIVPVSGGGIQFEWYADGRELELEIDAESGELIYLKVHEDETMEEDAYPVAKSSQTKELIDWLLNGKK